MLPMEKGTYTGVARASTYGESSNKNAQLALTFEIVDHEQYAGSAVTALLYFTPDTAERSIESLMHLGWEGEDLDGLANLDEAGCAQAFPNHVELVCEPEFYEGVWRLKVKWINKPGAGRFTFKQPLEGDALRAFSAQMRNTVRAVRAAGGAKRKDKPQQPAQRSLPNTSRNQGGAHPNAPGGSYPDEGSAHRDDGW